MTIGVFGVVSKDDGSFDRRKRINEIYSLLSDITTDEESLRQELEMLEKKEKELDI